MSLDSFESFESTALEALPFEELLDPNTPTVVSTANDGQHPLAALKRAKFAAPPSPSPSCDDVYDVVSILAVVRAVIVHNIVVKVLIIRL